MFDFPAAQLEVVAFEKDGERLVDVSFLPREQNAAHDGELKKRADRLIEHANSGSMVVDLNRKDFGKSYPVTILKAKLVSKYKHV